MHGTETMNFAPCKDYVSIFAAINTIRIAFILTYALTAKDVASAKTLPV